MVKLVVNGRPVDIDDGGTLLDAARAAGVHVATLCYHPRLPARAVCRMCLVSVRGQARPQPACITPAREGDVVDTDSRSLQDSRKANAEWLLARHPNDCMRCEVQGDCRLQDLVWENQWQEHWPHVPRGPSDRPEEERVDHTSPSIWRDLSKCVECGLCADACGDAGQQQHVIGFAGRGSDRLPVTVFDRPLAQTSCISCGQCTLVCPVGALVEKPHWHEVLRTLDSRRRVCVVQVAPATRVAIGEEFGLEPGTVSTGRLINALRRLGFDHVFDSNFGADLTTVEEATELLERLKQREHLPLFTSCCPGWVNWVEINRPDLLPHLSTCKSPQQMHAALTKRSRFARMLGTAGADELQEPCVVSVMPCTAKKDEALRPGMTGDVDHVLTTRELARMIKARGIAFGALPQEGRFDDPLGQSTGAGQIFGASGGVMEALARTASHLAGAGEPGQVEWQALRGVDEGIKTAEIAGVGKVAVCNGIAVAQRLLREDSWRDEYVAIEVMACVGGCLGGGGEPKSMDRDILATRMRAIYEIDRGAPRRRSHENGSVQDLYRTELEAPGSPAARALLHTRYAARHSARALLMRFLDAVDRRDGQGAARLFAPDGVWSTASHWGDVHGPDAIEALISRDLPARRYGPGFERHRLATAADEDDLTVLTPTGERCRFTVDVAQVEDGDGSRPVIRRLLRHAG